MKVVGVGCGPGMLTPEAIEAISGASIIYGSVRAIELARPHISKNARVSPITDYKRLDSLPAEAVVLSTGDPMLAGLGHLGGTVIPGISSMQVAYSRLHLPMTNTVILSAHGKDQSVALAVTGEELRKARTVCLLADPAFSIERLARALGSEGLKCRIALCENLGYEDERICIGTPDVPPVKVSGLFCLVIYPEQEDS